MPIDGHHTPAPRPGRPLEQGSSYPSAEMVHADAVADLVDADRVAVTLFAEPGHRCVVRGSDRVLVHFGDMVETVGQGPVYEVLRTAAPVAVDDVHATCDRWPVLSSAFEVPDLGSLLVLPLREIGGRRGPQGVFGVLVFSRRHRPFTAQETAVAASGADLLAVMVMARALHADPGTADEKLDELLDPRSDVLSRALGVACQRYGLTGDRARGHLQGAALVAGRTLHQVATDLLEGEE